MEWDISALEGPGGADWRVPPEELANRLERVKTALFDAGIESMIVHDPVDLYWLAGGRQNGMFLVGAKNSSIDSVFWVRQSLDRAVWESGESEAPFELAAQPRVKNLNDELKRRGCTSTPAMQHGRLPHNQAKFYNEVLGESEVCTSLLWNLREIKSHWEID